MQRTMRWEPDTHPSVSFDLSYDDADPNGTMVCTAAKVNGEVIEGEAAQAVYANVVTENRIKNQAEALLLSALPADMKKPVLDSDGDPTGEMTVKDKHRPEWFYGEPDGKLTFRIPGASADVLAAIAAELQPAFGEAVRLAD